jgi:hypothetical protein
VKRWLPITIFLLAILVFFISGRLESSRRKTAIQEYSAKVRLAPRNQAGRNPAPPAIEPHPGYLAPEPSPSTPASDTTSETTSVMAIVITVIFGLAGLWMVMTRSAAIDDERRRWALGTLGIIIGYWLKG